MRWQSDVLMSVIVCVMCLCARVTNFAATLLSSVSLSPSSLLCPCLCLFGKSCFMRGKIVAVVFVPLSLCMCVCLCYGYVHYVFYVVLMLMVLLLNVFLIFACFIFLVVVIYLLLFWC